MSKYMIQRFFFLSLLLIACPLFVQAETCSTVNVSAPVTRGTPTTINWNVTGAASCSGGFLNVGRSPAYPPGAGDGIYTSWLGSMRSSLGSSNFGGANVLAAPGTYTFTCQDLNTLIVGCADLVVNDCASNEAWNGTSCQVCGNGGCTNHICNNGAGDAPTCTPAASSCALPWGGSILSGQSTTTYQTSYVVSPSSCVSQTRTCTNGTLSGAYTNGDCKVMSGSLTSSAPSCVMSVNTGSCSVDLTWSTTNGVGTSAITRNNPPGTVFNGNTGGPTSTTVPGAYSSVAYFLYNSGDLLDSKNITTVCNTNLYFDLGSSLCKVCDNGGCIGPGGSFVDPLPGPLTCANGRTPPTCAPLNCTPPWGGTVLDGAATTSYQTANVPFGSTCTSESRSCTNGTLSGSFTNRTCVIDPPVMPSVTLSASPLSIFSGATSTLSFTMTPNPGTCIIDNGVGNVGTVSGQVDVGPLSSTVIYTLTCTNVTGADSDPATVTVLARPDLTTGTVSPVTASQFVPRIFSATITNSGNSSTGGAFDAFMQIADGPAGAGSVIDIPSISIPTIAQGASRIASSSYTFTTLGVHSVRFCADKSDRNDAGTITESNESNNCSGTWTNVNVTYTPPTGTLLRSPNPCMISSGSSTCMVTFTPTTINPIGPSQVVGDGGGPFGTVGNDVVEALPVGNGNQVFRLYNFSQEIATVVATGQCVTGTAWDPISGTCSTCQNGGCTIPNVCNNGATNPPLCNAGASIMSGTLGVVPSSCIIATGAGTCPVTLNWSTTNAVSYSAITSSMTGALEIYNAINNPGVLTNVPYSASGIVTYFLYNNTMMLDSKQVNVSCASGANRFDIISGTCADPQVIAASATGSYYNNPGSVNFTCLGADNYVVVRDPSGANVTIATGVYSTPVSIPVTISDTYSVVCRKGAIASSPSLVAYTTPPPPVATVEMNASPKTLNQGGKSTITWSIQYPTVACTLAAQAVCANNSCSQVQLSAAALLNTLIATTNTDSNDPNGVRPITTAVTTVAPANVGGNWKAVGKKTFTIDGTTDFTADCGAGNKATVRVRVTNSGEQ